MRITIISMGKLKESYFSQAEAEYQKRLSPIHKIANVELNPVKLPENPTQKEIAAALKKESELILGKIPPHSYLFALCIEGRQFSSEEFSTVLQDISRDYSEIYVVIGSSHGLADDVKQRADCKLSFSKMTLPHQLARVVLAEQLYRAVSIQQNKKYHK